MRSVRPAPGSLIIGSPMRLFIKFGVFARLSKVDGIRVFVHSRSECRQQLQLDTYEACT